MKQTSFFKQLAVFFDTYLPETRGCSQNTISSYADGFVILFRFFHEEKGKANYLINFKDLTPQLFDAYILWMQNTMHYSAATQKQRLAAVNSFLKYASRREMAAVTALSASENSKTPKIPQGKFSFFTVDEIKVLLRLPQPGGKAGNRDQTLLALLYDSGARAQEICDLKICDISFGQQNKIALHGKGLKVREVPISQDAAKLVKHYLSSKDRLGTVHKHEYLFPSQRGEKMTTSCIRSIVAKYVSRGRKEHPELFPDANYSPHSFRHSKAMHMLEAEVPLVYIRNFLGHESVQTTERYLKISQGAVANAILNHAQRAVMPNETSRRTDCNDNRLPDFIERAKGFK